MNAMLTVVFYGGAVGLTEKPAGGAVGLTENPAALRRWMIAGPGFARLVEEFEEGYDDDSSDSGGHHEQTKSVQDKFVKDVHSLVITIEEMGNPFVEESGDLLNLNSEVVMPEKVVKAMQSKYATGVTKYDTFIEERFKSGSKSLSETIPRNSLLVFSKPGVDNPKGAGKLPGLKNDRGLFSRLYIASQTREGDVYEFFRHENEPIPPALSNEGLIRTGKKCDLLDCLPSNETTSNDSPKVDAKVFNGPAVVHYLQSGTCATFDDYANDVFVPYMVNELSKVSRVDIVWDIYRPDSLKGTTRERRGTGTRRRVHASTRIPGNWQSFLRNDENKQELFRFLATKCIHYQNADEKEIYSTFEDEVLGSSNSVVIQLSILALMRRLTQGSLCMLMRLLREGILK